MGKIEKVIEGLEAQIKNVEHRLQVETSHFNQWDLIAELNALQEELKALQIEEEV